MDKLHPSQGNNVPPPGPPPPLYEAQEYQAQQQLQVNQPNAFDSSSQVPFSAGPPPPPRPGVVNNLPPTAPSGYREPFQPLTSGYGPPPGTSLQQATDLNTPQIASGTYVPPPPPRRHPQHFDDDDVSNPIHYTRDPRKIIAYLIPFPKPHLKEVDPATIPDRYLIYTPPPPPLTKPKEGEKEAKFHKVQRKWQEEVKEAKTSQAKTASWKGVKGKATKGINWAMGKTTTANLDFLNRMGGTSESSAAGASADETLQAEPDTKTVTASELVLVYPASIPGSQEQLREDFVNTMLRTKTKAQKDAVLATGLLPVSFAIDVLLTFVWPFGGLLEIDSVWLYSSARGAKIARNTTKRLSASSSSNRTDDTLTLTFTPSGRLEVLRRYLAMSCHERNRTMFPSPGPAPTESQVLEAIGWAPSHTGETKNWEDDQWEITEVKEDFKQTMAKGGKEWDKWCKAFEKEPEKALKK